MKYNSLVWWNYRSSRYLIRGRKCPTLPAPRRSSWVKKLIVLLIGNEVLLCWCNLQNSWILMNVQHCVHLINCLGTFNRKIQVSHDCWYENRLRTVSFYLWRLGDNQVPSDSPSAISNRKGPWRIMTKYKLEILGENDVPKFSRGNNNFGDCSSGDRGEVSIKI
jgi:hypothetical protein